MLQHKLLQGSPLFSDFADFSEQILMAISKQQEREHDLSENRMASISLGISLLRQEVRTLPHQTLGFTEHRLLNFGHFTDNFWRHRRLKLPATACVVLQAVANLQGSSTVAGHLSSGHFSYQATSAAVHGRVAGDSGQCELTTSGRCHTHTGRSAGNLWLLLL